MEQHGNVVFSPPFEYIQVGNNPFMLNVEVNNHKVCVCVCIWNQLQNYSPLLPPPPLYKRLCTSLCLKNEVTYAQTEVKNNPR